MSGGKRTNCALRDGHSLNGISHVENSKRARLSDVYPDQTSSGNLVDSDSLNHTGNPLGFLAEIGSRMSGISSQNANAGTNNLNDLNTGNLTKCSTRILSETQTAPDAGQTNKFDWVSGPPASRLWQIANFIEHNKGNVQCVASLLCGTIRGIANELNKNRTDDRVSEILSKQNDMQQVLNNRLKCLDELINSQRTLFSSVNKLGIIINGKVIPAISSIQTKERILEIDVRKIKKSSAEIENHLASRCKSRKFEKNDNAFRCAPENLCILNKPNKETIGRIERHLEEHPEIKSGKFKYDFINKHPDGNVYIHCNSLESQKGISNIIVNLGSNFKVRGVKKDFIYLRLGRIRTVNSTEEVIGEIINKDNRFRGKEDSLVFFKRFKDKQNLLKIYLVYKVDYDLAQELLKSPFTHYKERIRISKFRPLLHCHKCSRFGHSFKFCRSKELCCPNCAGNHNVPTAIGRARRIITAAGKLLVRLELNSWKGYSNSMNQ